MRFQIKKYVGGLRKGINFRDII